MSDTNPKKRVVQVLKGSSPLMFSQAMQTWPEWGKLLATSPKQVASRQGSAAPFSEAMGDWPEWKQIQAMPKDQALGKLLGWLQKPHERRNAVAAEFLVQLGSTVMRRLILEALTTRRVAYQVRLLVVVERMDAPLQPEDLFDLTRAFATERDAEVRTVIARIILQRRFAREVPRYDAGPAQAVPCTIIDPAFLPKGLGGTRSRRRSKRKAQASSPQSTVGP